MTRFSLNPRRLSRCPLLAGAGVDVIWSRSNLTGKVIREGMGQMTNMPDDETLDLIIMNAIIVDWSGIYKVRQTGRDSFQARAVPPSSY